MKKFYTVFAFTLVAAMLLAACGAPAAGGAEAAPAEGDPLEPLEPAFDDHRRHTGPARELPRAGP